MQSRWTVLGRATKTRAAGATPSVPAARRLRQWAPSRALCPEVRAFQWELRLCWAQGSPHGPASPAVVVLAFLVFSLASSRASLARGEESRRVSGSQEGTWAGAAVAGVSLCGHTSPSPVPSPTGHLPHCPLSVPFILGPVPNAGAKIRATDCEETRGKSPLRRAHHALGHWAFSPSSFPLAVGPEVIYNPIKIKRTYGKDLLTDWIGSGIQFIANVNSCSF